VATANFSAKLHLMAQDDLIGSYQDESPRGNYLRAAGEANPASAANALKSAISPTSPACNGESPCGRQGRDGEHH